MKNLFVRGLVVALAIVGFAASTKASTPATAKASVASLTTPPTCPPNDPNACGID